MATKRNGKSNKTAHVLNVLSGAQQEDSAEGALLAEPVSAASEEAQPAARRARAPRPPALEQAGAGDDTLAEAIRDSLSEELGLLPEDPSGAELSQAASPAAQTPAEETPVVETPVEETLTAETPVEETPLAETPVEETPLAETPVEETPLAETPVEDAPAEVARVTEAPAAPLTVKPPVIRPEIPGVTRVQGPGDAHGEMSYVNVMQALVEERTPRYIEMFGVCDCPRCLADVKALALTNLPPKYAVMREGEVIPMLTVYEGRYSTSLTAQILSACNMVKDRPRH